MAETWVIKDNAPVDDDSYELNDGYISFTSGGENFIQIGTYTDGFSLFLVYRRSDDSLVKPASFNYSSGETQFHWNSPAYKTLELDTEPDGGLLTWLQANAVKQQDKHTNKVVVNGETILDLTQDTVTPATLAKGATAHDKSGAPIVGTMEASAGGDYDIAAITNADGTQNLAITDAAGGGGSGGSGVTWYDAV